MGLRIKAGRSVIGKGCLAFLTTASLGLGLISLMACSTRGGAGATDAGTVPETDTDPDVNGDTGSDAHAIPTDTEIQTDGPPDASTEASTSPGTDTGTMRDAGSDAMPDTDSVDGTDDAAVPEQRASEIGVSSGSVTGESTHYSMQVFVGGGPMTKGLSAHYQITVGIGVLTQP